MRFEDSNPKDGFVQWIGLNPSTADEISDDPTIRRCMAFTRSWGFSSMCMTNLFAFRATQPKDMMRAEDPIGKSNGEHLIEVGREAAITIAAWGKDGRFKHRDADVIALFELAGIASKLSCLGTNNDGTPKHPLYLRKDLQPQGFPQ